MALGNAGFAQEAPESTPELGSRSREARRDLADPRSLRCSPDRSLEPRGSALRALLAASSRLDGIRARGYSPRMKRRALRLGLRLLGPALLVVVILRLGDVGAILRVLGAADLGPLALALGLTYVNLQAKVTRWDVILRARGIRYPQRRAWVAYLGAMYVGMLTPGRVGDALRAQYLKHDAGVGYAEGIASVVMDRLCDLYVLAVFSAIGVVRFSAALPGELGWIAWGGVGLTVLGPLALFVPGLAERTMAVAYRKVSLGREPEGFDRFLEALRAQLRARALALTLPLTVVAFAVNYLQGWLMARSLHLDVSFFDATCLLAIASLLGLLPISVSGVGLREAFFAVAFPVLGLPPATGVSFGLLVFVVLYLMSILIGFVSWQIAPPPTSRDPDPGPINSAPGPEVR